MLVLLTALAFAQDPVDVGVVTDADVLVVQKLLYPKAGRQEIGLSLGWMPWDPATTTPNAQFTADVHLSESFAFSTALGGGYGIKTPTYVHLERDHGVALDAFRYLTSLLLGVQYAPVYAKANISGTRIVHFDLYGAARGGVTLENAVIPNGGFAVCPTASLGIGTRIFLKKGMSLRIEVRDDLLLEHHKLTESTRFKQNANVLFGLTWMSAPEEEE